MQVRLRKKTLRSILLRAISGSKGTVGLEEIKKDEVLKNFGQRDVSGVVRCVMCEMQVFNVYEPPRARPLPQTLVRGLQNIFA